MSIQRPLIVANGRRTILPSGDSVLGASPFHELCHIAGMQPTLYLDFARQDFRHYSPSTGLREKALSDIVTFTRASAATYFGALGVMRTAGSNEPRLDFDPITGLCRGLLIEESRTNLFLNSLLDGANLATQTVTVTAAVHTISFYGTGSITLSGAHSATITGTSDTTRTTLTFTPTAGLLTCTVGGTVKWAQCELGSFATSFIATAGSTAQRAADAATISLTAFSDFYRQGAGTIRMKFNGTSVASETPLQLSDGTTNNRIIVTRRSSDGTMRYAIWAGGTNQIFYNVGPYAASDGNVTIAFDTSSAVILYNHLNAITLNAQIPVNVNSATIGGISDSSMINGPVARIAYWPKRLPDDVLKQLTA